MKGKRRGFAAAPPPPEHEEKPLLNQMSPLENVMPHHFAQIAFTPTVKKMQEKLGSRASYARMEDAHHAANRLLTKAEASFISARSSLYMATVSETGWPYIQHRGGPTGFVRVLGEDMIGFADFRGNRQYISIGNLTANDRISLFFMDYPNKTRLKLFGRVRIVGLDDRDMLSRLEMPDYRARIEHGLVITVEGYDWNCPQHIVERYTLDEVRLATAPLTDRIAELEAELVRINAGHSTN
ncbi:pyridoxamine 5'-phosphate oxidase family protein [Ferrovibrio sp.]|uniref:pyridoxamine 5'-phosphate oxidase family protein n=1 Tax=Ferrovibrio sp. TaxID=1917215 RepID=UPI00263787F2|nr:pyridoxamine 5'-phosphate oxidase family protein [Ferrovibrio sp.]